jgi:two-component system, NtrC family, nitrogen regulation response regulator NtrX
MDIVGRSQAIGQIMAMVDKIAPTTAPVLIQGESGTGKELIARRLHFKSERQSKPYVTVNCGALQESLLESELFGHEKGAFTGATSARRGKFELADGGTLFLDEVGDLHAASQAKLLRVLQEGEFHRVGGEQAIKVAVRVISATNRDLQELVGQQKFREDLYYRLCVVPIRVPALRERREDIRELVEYFLAEFCARNNSKPKSLDSEVIETLEDHHWPGNIRELRNTVERMAILTRGDALTAESIPVEIRLSRGASPPKGNLREAKESAEREHILRALDEAKWNVSSAARALGMERTNLHKRIRALGLTRETKQH